MGDALVCELRYFFFLTSRVKVKNNGHDSAFRTRFATWEPGRLATWEVRMGAPLNLATDTRWEFRMTKTKKILYWRHSERTESWAVTLLTLGAESPRQ